ncbi:MAG: RNA-binding protein [Methanocalculus sp. MSAO_Arc2]|uniref:H/ACA ribonucleoprotein complex subunit GAR1 n=1 Tax=Methanocalculus sp. MSAO_Arc2 TaxID=2293855 RepID=UPI000FF2064C|nr:MAG: RNA-binding protein [Methanocalculus sp. MSAO_Arc2]
MKFAGRILSICGHRLLVAECDAGQLPPLFGDVVNSRMKPVGRIVDLYGNIASPYATIVCQNDCHVREGEKLYLKERVKNAGNRKIKKT